MSALSAPALETLRELRGLVRGFDPRFRLIGNMTAERMSALLNEIEALGKWSRRAAAKEATMPPVDHEKVRRLCDGLARGMLTDGQRHTHVAHVRALLAENEALRNQRSPWEPVTADAIAAVRESLDAARAQNDALRKENEALRQENADLKLATSVLVPSEEPAAPATPDAAARDR